MVEDGGDPLLHEWAYDAMGRLSDATLPGNAADLMFEHFDDDSVMQVVHGGANVVTGLTYHPEGPVDAIDVSDGMDPLLLLDYTVDDVLNVDAISEKRGTGTPQAFGYGYDEVYRLTTADYPAAFGLPATDAAYAYDGAGNRDDADTEGDPLATHAYDGNNRITASPSTPILCHDADGNLTSKRSAGTCTSGTVTESFAWDASNRLRTYTDAATGLTAEYTYDPFGRRIRKVVDADGGGMTYGEVTTWYVWDGDQLLAEYDTSGDRQVRYAYAGGFAPLQVAYDDGSGGEDIYDVHSDHLDTPRMLTDASGGVRLAREPRGVRQRGAGHGQHTPGALQHPLPGPVLRRGVGAARQLLPNV